MEYLSVNEISEKWNISVQRVRYYCRTGRIPGVQRVGRSYLIPGDARKPQDNRTKNAREEKKGKKEKGTFGRMCPDIPVKPEFVTWFGRIPMGIVVIVHTSHKCSIVYGNRMAGQLLENADEISHQTDLEEQMKGIHPDQKPLFWEAVQNAVHGSKTQTVRFRYWSVKRREYRWLQLAIQKMEAQDELIYAVGSLVDVSKECRMIEELKNKTELLEKAESNSKIHYISYDVESKIMILESQTQWAYKLEDNILREYPEGTCRPDILYPPDYKVLCQNFQYVLEGKVKSLYFNIRVMGEEGFYYWRRIHIKGIYDEEGLLFKIRGTSIEIDHYIKLQESYSQALEQNEIASWEYDAKLKKSNTYGIAVDMDLFDETQLIRLERIHEEDRAYLLQMEEKLHFGILQQQLTLRVKINETEVYQKVKFVVTGMYEYDGKTIQKYLCTVREQ